MTLTIGILAGEPSGDRLGAGLMTALRARDPAVRFVGIGGERMLGAGLEPLAPMELLAVNGFIEPLRRLPQLIRLLKRLLVRYEQLEPDAFIGVDFNVFNLLVERLLRRRGIATAHYVSPSVYAWRSGRVRRVARAAELLLTLYPFEPEYYAGLPVRSVCVGHPLADEIGSAGDDPEARRAARRSLGIDDGQTCIAVLPGSRMSEVSLMLTGFLAACALLRQELGDVVFAVPCPTPAIEAEVSSAAAGLPDLPLVTYLGDARR